MKEGFSYFPAPAKLNLFLHVTGRRADGYHLLQTVFRFVDFGDDVGLRVREQGEVRRVGEVVDVAEADDLTVRAARLLKVIGSDLVPEFPTWHRSEDILSLAQLLVVQRSGHVTDSTQLAIPDVSSTEVRDRLAQGLDTSGKLCPLVAQYIKQRGLYVDLVKQGPQ